MKCPKCGYLGFETSDRCRNCGYDFSLSAPVAVSAELPLQPKHSTGVPLADLSLSDPARELRSPSPTPALDLDRVLGAPSSQEAAGEPTVVTSGPRLVVPLRVRAAEAPVPDPEPAAASVTPDSPSPETGLPLFGDSSSDDTPLITSPRPARAPLAVRRATPDVPRGRSRTRVTPRRDDSPLQLEPSAPGADTPVGMSHDVAVDIAPASAARRFGAMMIDGCLLVAIDAAVLYFTLAIASLTVAQVPLLPPIPLVAFLLILNGGYLVAFTVAGGQTIGKMTTGVRVMGDDGRRVDLAGAILRAAGCFLSVVTLGLGYLPVFFSADARALHDRIAGTRVVRN
jgi:uncharacterized RDD family membrane protein YckC